MKLGPFAVILNKTWNNISKRVEKLELDSELRPMADAYSYITAEGVRMPFYPINYTTMYDIANYSDVMQNIRGALKGEIFRNGYEIEEEYVCKCAKCGKEFDVETEKCDECGSVGIGTPDATDRTRIEKFFKKVNENGQSIIDVFRENEDDFNIVDNGYDLILKDYYFDDDTGEITGGEITEIIRGNPIYMKILTDRQGRLGRTADGSRIFICPQHRGTPITENSGNVQERCNVCGKRLYRAYYLSETPTETSSKNKQGVTYYMQGEVVHTTKYDSTLGYGFPRMLIVYQKVMALMYMDEYINVYYGDKKPPKAALFVRGSNRAGFQKVWDWFIQKTKTDPHFIHPIMIESDPKGGGKFVEFVDFMKSLNDMQYIETREEFRRSIGSVFGVQPIFQGDLSQGGGLNNEGLQITVTNRAVAFGQMPYNGKLFPEIIKQMGISGWKAKLKPSEEKDEMSELQREAQTIANAQSMSNLGFEVRMDDKKEFTFEKKKIEQRVSDFDIGSLKPESTATLDKKPQRFEGEPTDVRRSVNKSDIKKKIEQLILKEIDFVEKESDRNIVINKEGMGSLVDFIMNAIFTKPFEGMSKRQSDTIKENILDSYINEGSMKNLINKIINISGRKMSEEQAEVIARTETQAVSLKAREYAYRQLDPAEKHKFRWLGPTDARTSAVCLAIKSRTINGVSLEKLKDIIEEESKKEELTPREWTPHPNCRHVISRVF